MKFGAAAQHECSCSGGHCPRHYLALTGFALGAFLILHLVIHSLALRREKLKFGVAKHHHGSDLRQWLQRVSAVILLAFILFHVITLHRWLGGRFDPHSAFDSASRAIWQFWRDLPSGHPVNLLVAEFYVLGIFAAAYHVSNGIATGAQVLGLTAKSVAQKWLGRICLLLAPALLLVGLAAWHTFAPK